MDAGNIPNVPPPAIFSTTAVADRDTGKNFYLPLRKKAKPPQPTEQEELTNPDPETDDHSIDIRV